MAVYPGTLKMLESLDGLPKPVATALAETRQLGALLDADNASPPQLDDIARSVLAARESERMAVLKRGIDALVLHHQRQGTAGELRKRFALHSEAMLFRAVDAHAEELLAAMAGPGWETFAVELHAAAAVLPPHLSLSNDRLTREQGAAYGLILAATTRLDEMTVNLSHLSPVNGPQLLRLPPGVSVDSLVWSDLPHISQVDHQADRPTRLLDRLRKGARLRVPHPSREAAADEVGAKAAEEAERRAARRPVVGYRMAGY